MDMHTEAEEFREQAAGVSCPSAHHRSPACLWAAFTFKPEISCFCHV